MRILYSHRIQSRDGQAVHVEELIRAFREDGHEVLVVGPAAYDKVYFGGENRVIALTQRLLSGALGEIAELAYNFISYTRLVKAWHHFQPDIVYERYNLFHLAGSFLARRKGVLFYLEVNSPIAAERRQFSGLRLKWLANAVERYTWKSATRIFAVTDVLKGIIATSGVQDAKIEVAQNGVVLSRFSKRKPSAVHSVVLGFVGFVRAWHGLDAVIRGMAAAPDASDVRLVVVGSGPVLDELESLSETLGIAERVSFRGVVDHTDIPNLVAEFDIALQPKATPYASPLKIFDYMAAGCAIVAPDQPNIREILEHKKTALLFEPDQPDSLWRAIRTLTRDAQLRESLGRAAQAEIIGKDYTWAGNARRIAEWAAADRSERGSAMQRAVRPAVGNVGAG
jgi:glycosyltransferase involved in cell wall biosynthesis